MSSCPNRNSACLKSANVSFDFKFDLILRPQPQHSVSMQMHGLMVTATYALSIHYYYVRMLFIVYSRALVPRESAPSWCNLEYMALCNRVDRKRKQKSLRQAIIVMTQSILLSYSEPPILRGECLSVDWFYSICHSGSEFVPPPLVSSRDISHFSKIISLQTAAVVTRLDSGCPQLKSRTHTIHSESSIQIRQVKLQVGFMQLFLYFSNFPDGQT